MKKIIAILCFALLPWLGYSQTEEEVKNKNFIEYKDGYRNTKGNYDLFNMMIDFTGENSGGTSNGSLPVVTSLNGLVEYADTSNTILWNDPNRGGFFMLKTGGTIDSGLVFPATNQTGNWERVRENNSTLMPKWYGALADGSTNDSAAFLKMFEFNPNGGDIYLGDSTDNYYFGDRSAIFIPSGARFIGNGANITVKPKWPLFRADGKRNISFDGITFNGGLSDTISGSNASNLFLTFKRCNGISITNCRFNDMTLRSINSYDSHNGIIQNCSFYNMRTDITGIIPIALAGDTLQYGSKHWLIDRCTFINDVHQDSASIGAILIVGKNDGPGIAEDITISNCYFKKMGRLTAWGGPRGDIDVYNDVRDLKIIDNVSDSSTNGFYKGNDIDGLLMSGNIAKNSIGRSVNHGDRYNVTENAKIRIVNNFFSGGIKIVNTSGGGGEGDVEVSNNTIDNTGYTSIYGIWTGRMGANQVISDNTIISGGIYVEKTRYDSADFTTNWLISGNIVDVTEKGVHGIDIDARQQTLSSLRPYLVNVFNNNISNVNDTMIGIKWGPQMNLNAQGNQFFNVLTQFGGSNSNTQVKYNGLEFTDSKGDGDKMVIGESYIDTVRNRRYIITPTGIKSLIVEEEDNGAEYFRLYNQSNNKRVEFWADDTSYVWEPMGVGTKEPLAYFHVKTGESGISGGINTNYNEAVYESINNTGITILTANNKNSGIAFGDEDNAAVGAFVYLHSEDRLDLYTNATRQLVVHSDGDVGIGTGTDAPDEKLEVNGNIKADTLFGVVANAGGGSFIPHSFITSNFTLTASDSNSAATNNTASAYTITLDDGLGWRIGATMTIMNDSSGVVYVDDGTATLRVAGATKTTDTIPTAATLKYLGNETFVLYNSVESASGGAPEVTQDELDSSLIAQDTILVEKAITLTDAHAGKLFINTTSTDRTITIPTGLTFDAFLQKIDFEPVSTGDLILDCSAVTVTYRDAVGSTATLATTVTIIQGASLRRTGTNTYTLTGSFEE